MIHPSIVNNILASRDGEVLVAFLKETIEELNTLDRIDWSDKEKATIEGRARELAKEKLTKILEPFLFNATIKTEKNIFVKNKNGL